MQVVDMYMLSVECVGCVVPYTRTCARARVYARSGKPGWKSYTPYTPYTNFFEAGISICQ
jgi:hypothetical protein